MKVNQHSLITLYPILSDLEHVPGKAPESAQGGTRNDGGLVKKGLIREDAGNQRRSGSATQGRVARDGRKTSAGNGGELSMAIFNRE